MSNLATGISDGRLRWGILGTGFIAGLLTQDLVNNGFTVQAVGSRSVASGTAFSQKFGIPSAHFSYEALVEDPDVDVVYVATPHAFHHTHALLALNAGKHVLVEKPFAMNAREAQEIVDLAAEKGLVVLEAMWTRFLPHMVRLRDIIAEGKLGDVRKVVASHNQDLPKDPAHRLNDPALGGGALLDLGIYPISFAFDVLGTPTAVRASASKTVTGVDRQTAVIFEYAHGQQALLDCELDAAGANRAVVIGNKGWIDIESVWYTPTTFTLYGADGGPLESFAQTVQDRGMQYQAVELERLVHEGAISGAILPPHESVAVMVAMDEIRQQIGLVYDADGPLERPASLDSGVPRTLQLRQQEEDLVFHRFDNGDAWVLGAAMASQAKAEGHAVAIDIRRHNVTLFHCSLPGATEDQSAWIRRKAATTLRFERSTALLKEEFSSKGIDPTLGGWLDTEDYTLAGGSFPIRVRGVGVVGAITVSGLASDEDHEFVISHVRKHIALSASTG